MCHVRTDIHQMGDAATALSLGIALEEFTYLEEQHDEDGLWDLGLGTRQKTDGKSADGGHRHQEVLVEGIAVCQTLGSFFQRLVTYQQIRNEIDQQQLPCRQRPLMLDDDGAYQQHRRQKNQRQLLAQRVLLVVMLMAVPMTVFVMMLIVVLVRAALVFMFVVVMMFVCHIFTFFFRFTFFTFLSFPLQRYTNILATQLQIVVTHTHT